MTFMKSKLPTMLLVMLAGWINRHQQDMIEYLKEENNVLREKLGTKRLLLNDAQRRRLAVLAKRLASPHGGWFAPLQPSLPCPLARPVLLCDTVRWSWPPDADPPAPVCNAVVHIRS